MTVWPKAQAAIDACRLCETRGCGVTVPDGPKLRPLWPPPNPCRIYFIGVAPPGGKRGKGTYFWIERQRDNLREGLFRVIEMATGSILTPLRTSTSRATTRALP